MLAADIDGTLLDSRAELRPRTREALQRAVQAGIHVVLSTGRRYRTALPFAREIGLALPLICHSGALVKDTGSHRSIHTCPLARGSYELLLDTLAEQGLTPMVYTDSYDTGADFFIQQNLRLTSYHEDYLAKNDGHFHAVGSLASDVAAPVVQVCTFAELEALEAVRPRLHERLDGHATVHLLSSAKYLGYFLEFQNVAASKWGAVVTTARDCGIAAPEIVAVGDDENDISMLRGAGVGVAMGNASHAVKSADDVVTAANDDDGVARLVDKLLESR
jgi:hypothetical protein